MTVHYFTSDPGGYTASKYPKCFSFDANAGHDYRVNGGRERNDWSAYVEDVTKKNAYIVCGGAPARPSIILKSEVQGGNNAMVVTFPDDAKTTITNPHKDSNNYTNRQKSVGEAKEGKVLKVVDWTRIRAENGEMTPEQAMASVRASLERMGQQMVREGALQGGSFVLERVDRSGFAFKLEVDRRQNDVVMKAAIPKSVSFGEVTELGIKKADSGQEIAIALLAGKARLWELPFANSAGRDRLLSALYVLCDRLTARADKEKSVVTGSGGRESPERP